MGLKACGDLDLRMCRCLSPINLFRNRLLENRKGVVRPCLLLSSIRGTGGAYLGAVNGSYQEKNYTLSIGLKVRDYLLANDQTNMRADDEDHGYDGELGEPDQSGNSNNADYFCSIHINAAAERAGKVTSITEPSPKKPSTRKTPSTAR